MLNNYVESIKNIFGNALKSVVLYGSRAAEENLNSDINLIIVLEQIDFGMLEKLSKANVAWTKSGNPLPKIFSMKDIETSCDVFPLEFLEIKASRKVLYGQDLFENLALEDKYLRHQCEYELKSKVLSLRQVFSIGSNDENSLRDVLVKQISSVLILLKYSAKLVEGVVHKDRVESLKTWNAKVGLKKEIFESVLGMKRGVKPEFEIKVLYKEFVTGIEKVSDYINDKKV